MTFFNDKRYYDFGPTSSLNPVPLIRARQHAIEELMSHGLPYSRKLSKHTSCVNALTFSSGEGRWLASAGDDPYVLLWDFHQNDLKEPTCGFIGHRANVFALAFSAMNHFLLSGDTDNTIHRYDITRLSCYLKSPGEPVSSYSQHRDSIRALSSHPEEDDIFLSAGEDGVILLHDARVQDSQTRAQGTLIGTSEFTSVQYHPIMHNLFITANGRGEVHLCDARMAFDRSPLSRRGVVQEYVTALSKQSVSSHLSRPEVGSVVFDKTGSKLAVTMLHYLPTIYGLTDPYPVATCSGHNLPDGSPVPAGERTYSNSCTIKHGSFGGPGLDNDIYYTAGSDDFRTYVWKIPELSVLKEARERISAKKWNEGGDKDFPDRIGFTHNPSRARYVPVELSTPLCRLGGHKSIVNTALIHPYWPHVVTAGVESHIVLHSPVPSSPCLESTVQTSSEVRELPEANADDQHLFVRTLVSGRSTEDTEDDRETIALFDEILRQEGTADIFEVRQWYPAEDEDEEMSISLKTDSESETSSSDGSQEALT